MKTQEKKTHIPCKYVFTKYKSIYDETIVVYALKSDGVEKVVDGIKFIEVTPDFERVQMARLDSLTPIGSHERLY